MPHRHLWEESLHSALAAASDSRLGLTRRTVLLAPLLAALPLAFSGRRAEASETDPKETIITLPKDSSGPPGPACRRTAVKWRRSMAAWTSRGLTSS